MPKIAVMYKPYHSWFSSVFQTNWFWEYNVKELLYTTELKWKKYLINWVQSEEIFDLYQYLSENYDNSYSFVLSVNIKQLFEDEELKELSNFI